MFKHFLLGFFAKTVASLDDTATKVPVLAAVARTRFGKYAFAFGSLIALFVTLVIAGSIASLIAGFAYARFILGAIIIALAVMIRFDILTVREKKVSVWGRLRARTEARRVHFFRLTGIGFLVTLVTLIDDTFAYLPLLNGEWMPRLASAGGIILSAIIQLYILIYFAEALQKFRYAKQVSFYGLLTFAALILAGVV